ncbi:hypothetical protein [Massilia haematophila]|uniref:Transposase n=1 Tax=Massilia haematophila TaxID=457923 RepID=A0ABV7PM62_9BURK
MIERRDKATAFKVDIAIHMMRTSGKLAVARFMDKHCVPLDVTMRVLGETSGGTRQNSLEQNPLLSPVHPTKGKPSTV